MSTQRFPTIYVYNDFRKLLRGRLSKRADPSKRISTLSGLLGERKLLLVVANATAFSVVEMISAHYSMSKKSAEFFLISLDAFRSNEALDKFRETKEDNTKTYMLLLKVRFIGEILQSVDYLNTMIKEGSDVRVCFIMEEEVLLVPNAMSVEFAKDMVKDSEMHYGYFPMERELNFRSGNAQIWLRELFPKESITDIEEPEDEHVNESETIVPPAEENNESETSESTSTETNQSESSATDEKIKVIKTGSGGIINDPNDGTETPESLIAEIPFLLNGYTSFNVSGEVPPSVRVQELADEMIKLLSNLTNDKGKMIGVFGHWGRGKTYLMETIWDELEEQEKRGKPNPFIRVDFHAWKYQDTPASWAYLYEAFAEAYLKSERKTRLGRWLVRLGRILRLNFARKGWFPLIGLILVFGGWMAYALFKDWGEQLINGLIKTGSAAAFLAATYFTYGKTKDKASKIFAGYFKRKSYSELLGVQAEIQKELRSLLSCWINIDKLQKKNEPPKHKRILLVVDDIDRCYEERIIQIIDALRIMLDDDEISNRVVVLAAVDERVLKRAIKWKYYDLLERDHVLRRNLVKKGEISENITSEYMDKLFLSGIKLGILTPEERKEIFTLFSAGKVVPTKSKTSEENTNTKTEQEQPEPQILAELSDEVQPSNSDTLKTLVPPVDPRDRTSPRKQKDVQEPAPEPVTETPGYELTEAEDSELQNLLGQYQATPRQIRIFYYRYLLARNFLSRRTGKTIVAASNSVNESVLGYLLLYYTSKGADQVLIDKQDLLKQTGITVPFKIGEADRQLNRKMLLETLAVLEMVIAY